MNFAHNGDKTLNLKFSFHKLRLLWKEYQTGVYLTVIFHLCILIAFFGLKIHAVKYEQQLEIAMDFTQEEKEEELEKLARLEREKQNLEREVNQMLSQVRNELRNVAVNEELAAQQSKEQNQVLHENDELQRRIDATRRMMQERPSDEGNIPAEPVKKSDTYTGPSVMSYKLDGRTAYRLPVPVYKCEGGGMVVVNIMVAQRGNVVGALVDVAASAKDPCLQDMAIKAAEMSKFSASTSSKNQLGTITYRFVGQ